MTQVSTNERPREGALAYWVAKLAGHPFALEVAGGRARSARQAFRESRHELAGLGVQGFVGARFLILKNLGVFTEYKFSHSALEVAVPSGQGRVQENTHHLVGGITIHFGSF